MLNCLSKAYRATEDQKDAQSTGYQSILECKRRRVDVHVPVPQNVHIGTVDPETGTWELTDKSLGAGVAVGPHGAQLLTAKPGTVRTCWAM